MTGERGARRINTDNTHLWLHRRVQGESLTQLTYAAEQFKKKEALRKRGDFTISLLYPADIYMAIDRSRFCHSLTPLQVRDILLSELPESADQSVKAESRSIWQYGSLIGVEVDMPEFEEERAAIECALRSILGIRYIRKVNPHVSLAKGWLGKVTNVNEIESALPEVLELSPVYTSAGDQR